MNAKSTKRSWPRAERRDLTDWDRVHNMTEEEIEVGVASDPDNPAWTEEELKRARVVRGGSARKPVIWVHVDPDVAHWVRKQPGDVDQMINDVLRSLMEKECAPPKS